MFFLCFPVASIKATNNAIKAVELGYEQMMELYRAVVCKFQDLGEKIVLREDPYLDQS